MDEKIEHSEASCIKALRSYFQNGYTYRIDRAFIFNHDWECDFFCMNRDGYSFEFEIKISRSDFHADKKKYKHAIFRDGFVMKQRQRYNKETRGWDSYEEKVERIFIPNRFYYVVPDGLVKKEEVPSYAGLIYVTSTNTICIVKRAPFIHKRKMDFRKVLCDKFYNRFLLERRERSFQKYEVDALQEKINAFKEKFPNEYSTLYSW